MNTTGVVPALIVAPVACTGVEVAGLLELLEEVDALGDVVGRSALGEVGHHHAVQRGVGRGRVAVQRDRALELRAEQVVQRGDRAELAGVADRHVAAVVLVPQSPVDSFCAVGMSAQVATWYGANRLVLASATAMPTSSTSGALAVPCCDLTAFDLLLAGAVRVGGVDLDAVLGGEGLHDVAVVRPVGGSAMTLSVPSFLAAATSAFMPPPAAADVCVAQSGAAARAARGTRGRAAGREQARGRGARERQSI